MPKRQPTTSRRTETGFICRICRVDKTESEYEADRNTRSGFRSECAACHRESKLAAYYRSKDRTAEERKEKYDKAADVYRKRALESYHRHREARSRTRKAYLQNNPGKAREWNSRRRALLCGAVGTFTREDVDRIIRRQRGLCFWCGLRFGKSPIIDHVIPLSRGGANYPENLVAACRPCNSSKYDLLPAEWRHGRRRSVRCRPSTGSVDRDGV